MISCSRRPEPVKRIASSSAAVSPMTIGVQFSYTFACYSALTAISAPIPAGSPIEIPMIFFIYKHLIKTVYWQKPASTQCPVSSDQLS